MSCTNFPLEPKKNPFLLIKSKVWNQVLFLVSVQEVCGSFSSSWCGWQNAQDESKWREETSKGMQQSVREILEDLKQEEMHTSLTGKSNYEVHFPAGHESHIRISDLPDLTAFTVCLWMKTDDSSGGGTPFWYRVRDENVNKNVVIGLLDYRGFYAYVGSARL